MKDDRTNPSEDTATSQADVGSWSAATRSSSAAPPARPQPVRGACPSLSAPMQTGDGLLVRLRPANPGLTLRQLQLLAEAAAKHGNGIIEITARGNLQLRGMTPQSMAGLSDDIDLAAIVPQTGVTIETPPLSGVDPGEICSARRMAEHLRLAIAEVTPPLLLAPKLAIVVDGGGSFGLDAVSADIRLQAVVFPTGSLGWAILVGGTSRSARFVGVESNDNSISAVIDLLKRLANIGPCARGRDLVPEPMSASEIDEKAGIPARHRSSVGIHRLVNGKVVLGVRLRFGQIVASDLIAFAALAEHEGASDIRLAPNHSFLVLGLQEEAARLLQLAAANFGLLIDPADPADHIAACAGAGGCASGFYQTKAAAAEFLTNGKELLDGSIEVHFSGCAKGCAHPGPAAIAVVGTPTGYGLVVNGVASARPVAYIGENDLQRGLAALGRLVHEKKHVGESADACLKRLDAEAIATALRQG